jgi:hypothetical protein
LLAAKGGNDDVTIRSWWRRVKLGLLYVVLILLAAEFLPPILYGNECDGLDAIGSSCVTYAILGIKK